MFSERYEGWRSLIIPTGAYALLWLLFFAPVWATGRLLAPGDAWLQSVPAYLAGWQTWTPFLMSGFPVAADPITMSFYPILLLFQLLGVPWNLFVMSAYLIAACTAHVWIGALTGSRTAAWVAGLTYSMSGFMLVHLQHTALVHAAAWVPLLLWGVDCLRRGDSRRGFAGLAVGATMLWLAEHPQIALYGSGLAAIYAVASLFTLQAPIRIRMLRWGVAAMGLVVMLTAVFWLPVSELAQVSGRAAITLDYFLSYSLNPRDLIQFFFPMLWGGDADSFYGTPYFGGETHAGQGFVGYLPWLLALTAWRLYPARRQVVFWSVAAMVAVLLALGGSTPVGGWMFYVPGYNMFRVPARNLLEFTIAMTALAGFGTAALERAVKEQRLKVSIRAILLAGGGFIALVAALQLVEPQIAAAAHKWMGIEGWRAGLGNPAVLVPLLSLIVVAALFMTAIRYSQERYLLPLAVVAGLFGYSGFAGWKYDAPAYAEMPAPLEDIHEESQWRILGAGRAYGDEEVTSWPRTWQLKAADGYNPLGLVDYRKVLEMTPFGEVDAALFGRDHRALDMLAVRYIYADAQQQALLDRNPERFGRMNEYIRINRHALPRARWVGKTVPLSKEATLAAIRKGVLPSGDAFDPTIMALVAEGMPAASYDAGGMIEWMADSSDEVVLKVKSEGKALLLLADTFYPGWVAEVDGQQAPMLRANLVSRAVELPAGEHQLHFAYRPVRLYTGIAVSAAGLILLLVLWMWRRRGVSNA